MNWGRAAETAVQVEWNNMKKPRGPKSWTVRVEGWMR